MGFEKLAEGIASAFQHRETMSAEHALELELRQPLQRANIAVAVVARELDRSAQPLAIAEYGVPREQDFPLFQEGNTGCRACDRGCE